VAEVVESDRPDHRLDPELPPVLRAPPLALLGRALDVAAPLPPADVPVALDDAGAPERAPQRVLEAHVPAHHGAIRLREHERGRRSLDRDLQKRHELGRDWDAVLMTALRRAALVRARHRQDLSPEVHVRLSEREQLALQREKTAPVRRSLEELQGMFDQDALQQFDWPGPEERAQRRIDLNTRPVVETPTEKTAGLRWDFDSMIWSIMEAEYVLLGCQPVGGGAECADRLQQERARRDHRQVRVRGGAARKYRGRSVEPVDASRACVLAARPFATGATGVGERHKHRYRRLSHAVQRPFAAVTQGIGAHLRALRFASTR
jgi:hypothetical protein